MILDEILQEVSLEVWADGRPGRAKMAKPRQVRLHSGAKIPNLKQ